MDKFKDMTLEALEALAAEKRTAGAALLQAAGTTPTQAQVEQALALSTELDEIDAEMATRKEQAQKFAGLGARFAEATPEPEPAPEPAEQNPPVPEAEPDAKPEPATEPDPTPTGEATQPPEQAAGGVAELAAKTERPQPPNGGRGTVTITAAADVPEFSSGQRLDTSLEIAKAVINRAKGFTAPDGDGKSVDLRQFGTAKIEIPFPDDLVIDREHDAMDVLKHAADEHRLPGGSLTASAGWCAPSETVYDLSNDATDEGLLSLPEVSVKRGGIRFAASPDFAAFYANPGFIQTEAQAIAGTTKPCVEVPCPSFTDVRLDAEGLCIKVPILLNAAYPEVVSQFVTGTMNAHLHWINANVIGRLVTAAGAARDATQEGIGSTAADTIAVLELLADQRRQQWRLSMGASMEVVVPFWVKGAVRNDLGLRTGRDKSSVSDAEIAAHFAVRNLNVQYVYDWQLLPTVDVGGTAGFDESMVYPASFQALMYPAGTFVKGVAPVINLNTVYDAASLAVNTYTGLFTEQGLLVAKMKFAADLVTLPVCSAGRTGAHDLTCGAAAWAK